MPIFISLEVIASVSTLASLAVVITILSSRVMRPKIFNQIILFISVCDFCGAFAVFFGNPPENMRLCYAQGLFVNFFFSAAVGWITILSHALFNVVEHGKIVLRRRYMHLIVWLISFIKAVVPLTTLSYSSRHDGLWCNLVPDDDNQVSNWTFYLWDVISNVIYYAVCMGLIIYWSVSIKQKLSNNEIAMSTTVKIVLDALYIYPVSVVVCYGILLLANFIGLCGRTPSQPVLVLGEATIAIHGLFVAIVFFMKSKEARDFWIRIFCGSVSGSISFASGASQSKERSTLSDAINPMSISFDSENSFRRENEIAAEEVL